MYRVACSLPGSSVHGVSPSKNTRVGCHVFLQGIFPTQGSNPGLLHCRQILHCLSHQVSPDICVCITNSLHCTAEINNIVHQLYSNKNLKNYGSDHEKTMKT